MCHPGLLLTLILFVIPQPFFTGQVIKAHLQKNNQSEIRIETPVNGQVIQGSVVIRGNTGVGGFKSAEVGFSYSQDKTRTLFLIQESTVPVRDGILTVWDTTTISDGEYSLRLMVNLTDGNLVEVAITGLRVRNYSPMETDTPAPFQKQSGLTPSSIGKPTIPIFTPTQISTTLHPAPSPLPTNPVMIPASQVLITLGKGAALTLGIFSLLGGYIGIQALLHNRK